MTLHASDRAGAPPSRARALHVWLLMAIASLGPSGVAAQTIEGLLLDADNGTPIDLGILVLLTAEGDTAGLTATDPSGRFTVSSAEAGAFMLSASAWGYVAKEDGVFELGPGSRLEVEFRLAPRAIELDGILVTAEAPTPDHPLILNGFVERYRTGLGHFVSPRDLDRSAFVSTEALFHFVPGVRLVTSTMSAGGGGALGTDIERVVMRGPFGWCGPTVFVDAVRTPLAAGMTLSELLPVYLVGAVEIYRNPAAVPPEFGPAGECGVIVFWTKR